MTNAESIQSAIDEQLQWLTMFQEMDDTLEIQLELEGFRENLLVAREMVALYLTCQTRKPSTRPTIILRAFSLQFGGSCKPSIDQKTLPYTHPTKSESSMPSISFGGTQYQAFTGETR